MPLRIDDRARRARLVARHRLNRAAEDVLQGVRSVTAMHSSDPLTPYLGLWARVRGFAFSDLARALGDARSVCRMHAMRRTLFVVPADEVGIFEAGATRPIAAKERRRVEGWAPGVDLRALEAAVVDALGDGERSTKELFAAVPELTQRVEVGTGKWSSTVPLGSRLLYVMAMDGAIVRAGADGTWRSSRYRWAAREGWFGARPDGPDPATARAEVLRRYLANHGPATTKDLRWWTGWTARDVKVALAALDAEQVDVGVVVRLLEDVGTEARAAVDGEAERLTAILDGAAPVPRFRTPLEKELAP